MEPEGGIFGVTFASCIMTLAAFLAWRNIHLRRGDTRGASRLAVFALLMGTLLWVCAANHVPTPHEFVSFFIGVSLSLLGAVVLWILYVALEPYVRRRLPQIMITWSRLLGGGVRDALVGGHLLIGIAFGVICALLGLVYRLLLEQPGAFLDTFGNLSARILRLDSMLDARHMTLVLDDELGRSIFNPLILLFFFFLLRVVFRRLWLAVTALVVVSVLFPVIFQAGFLNFVYSLLYAMLTVCILIRFGVLALIVGFFVDYTLLSFPLTADLSTWYAGSSLFAIASVRALTAYALYTALAGRPLLKAGFLDSD
jgi:hypothetical protein